MVAVPLLFGTASAVSRLRQALPPLYTIMVLHIAIAPITSSAAFVALIGLDTTFSLTTLILRNAVAPLPTIAFSYLFLGTSLVRRFAGFNWIERQRDHIDGAQCHRHIRFRDHRDGGRAAQRDRPPAVCRPI
jgi:hypothetical protein